MKILVLVKFNLKLFFINKLYIMNFFENIDPFSKKDSFSKEDIIKTFLKLIQNKDKRFLMEVQKMLHQRLIELS